MNVEDFSFVKNLYAYVVSVSLYEHGFKSIRFRDFETESKTMQFRGAYTELIGLRSVIFETSSTEISNFLAVFVIVRTNTCVLFL